MIKFITKADAVAVAIAPSVQADAIHRNRKIKTYVKKNRWIYSGGFLRAEKSAVAVLRKTAYNKR